MAAVDEVRLLFKYYDLASAAAKNYHLSTSNNTTPMKTAPGLRLSPAQTTAKSLSAEAKSESFMSPTVLSATATRTPFASHYAPDSDHGDTPTAAIAESAAEAELANRVASLQQQLLSQEQLFTTRLNALEQLMERVQSDAADSKVKVTQLENTKSLTSVAAAPAGGIITELQLVSAALLFMLCMYSFGGIAQMLGFL